MLRFSRGCQNHDFANWSFVHRYLKMDKLPMNLGCLKTESGWIDKQTTFDVEPCITSAKFSQSWLSLYDCFEGPTFSPSQTTLHKVRVKERKVLFTPQPLRARIVVARAGGRTGGRAAGQTSPVNTLTSTIFHGSFSNLARTFIALRSRTSSIMEVLPHQICA